MSNLTTKELAGIADQLSGEKIMIAKYKMYSESTQDPVLKSKLCEIANKHQTHFDKLFSLLG